MNDHVLSEALDDVKLIKQVIGRTAESLLCTGKIFLLWGILFLIRSSLNVSINSLNRNFWWGLFKKLPLLNFLMYPAFILLAILIFLYVPRKMELFGLSKKIVKVWLFIAGFNAIVPQLVLRHDLPIGRTEMINLQVPFLLASFAFGLYFTYILTNLKLTKWMSIIYIIISFFAFLPGKIPNSFDNIVWPLTFLVLGVYLSYRNKQVRGN